jgi:hypothetical protein
MISFKLIIGVFLIVQFSLAQDTLYYSDIFTVTDNAVYEGEYEAIALSPTEILSNYESAFRPGIKRIIRFKFSINGLDNERPPLMDHFVEIDPEKGEFITPVFNFGESDPEEIDIPEKDEIYLEKINNVNVLFRLDMRKVLREMKSSGFYQSFDGSIIRKEKFNGVYIVGEELPLTWNFHNLFNNDEFKLSDVDNDSIYEVRINFRANPDRPIGDNGYSYWRLKQNISDYPAFSCSNILLSSLYNLSLEELVQNIRPDSTFMAGAKWPGIWTRDISYSTYLSLALLKPEIAKNSLLAKVKNDKIIQDTGTGGSWPVSTDRIIWAIAAWEIYLVTGDFDWLKRAFQIIKNSVKMDLNSIIDNQTGLFYGESSFLDWREQSYPTWMDPKDIYMSLNLSTNVLHYQTYNILHQMADILKEQSEEYQQMANTLKNAINTYFWLAEKGYYGQYIYGRNYKTLSQKSESLGEALSLLFDIAGEYQNKKIVANTPILIYGIPCFFPQIANIPSYHNNGIWPFVQSLWTWAAAKTGNSKAVNHGLASVTRAAALFLTNKENFVASTGNFIGTEINSDRQLWSVAGNLALVYRIIFGMDFESNELVFKPLIPKPYIGQYELKNFRYRDANLNITVEGYGNEIDSFFVDDNLKLEHKISGDLKGKHSILIKLSNILSPSSINVVENHITPSIEKFEFDGDELDWEDIDDDPVYLVLRNGKVYQVINESDIEIPDWEKSVEFQVLMVDNKGYRSFLSEPIWIKNEQDLYVFQPDKFNNTVHTAYEGYTGEGYIPLTTQKNTKVTFTTNIENTGIYSIDFRYANGNGPINTGNKCAIRTLSIDDNNIGIIVLPQRGLHQWTNWGYSNSIKIHLTSGNHTIGLNYYDFNQNMNGVENVAFLDHLRLRYLNPN